MGRHLVGNYYLMIVEIGHFALLFAIAVALMQMTIPFYGAQTGDISMMALAEPAPLLQFGLVIKDGDKTSIAGYELTFTGTKQQAQAKLFGTH